MLEKEYLIVLGASFHQVDIYQTASRLGLKTLAVDYNPKAPARKIADKFLLASIKDKNECLTGLKSLKAKYKGIVTSGIEAMPIAAAIAKEFKLKSVSEETAYKTTNKCARIVAFQKAGIPVPKFEIIDSFFHPHLDYPLVIKPSDNAGSRGVQIVASRKDWPAAYKEAVSFSSDARVIVEELLHGDEISIEGFILNGKMFLTAFADRNYISGYYPYFMEDGCTMPTILEKRVISEAQTVFFKAAKALGIEEGPAKGDLIVTKDGVKVFEVASRFSPLFPIIMPFVAGINHLEALIRWACKMAVSESLLKPKFQKAMAHRYYHHKPGKIVSIKGVENLEKQAGVKKVIFLKDFKIGDVLEVPTYVNRLFYLTAFANDRNTAIKMAEKALATVKIETD